MTTTVRDAGLGILDDPEKVSTILPPLRRRMLSELSEPASATELSRRLGISRQKANYHLRSLEEAGFAELHSTRKRRGCTERLLRATRRAWVLDPDLVGRLEREPDEVRDRFSSAWLAAEAMRLASDVTKLARRAGRKKQKLATFSLAAEARFRSPARFRAFIDDVEKAFRRALAEHGAGDDERGARTFRILLGACPEITRKEASEEDE